MKSEDKIMEMIHKIREKHYKETKNQKFSDIAKSMKKEAEGLISKLNLKYIHSNSIKKF
ncbi:MAG: hypothetical protein ACP5OB_06930 [Candidatus Ratteibacteria bacterium]